MKTKKTAKKAASRGRLSSLPVAHRKLITLWYAQYNRPWIPSASGVDQASFLTIEDWITGQSTPPKEKARRKAWATALKLWSKGRGGLPRIPVNHGVDENTINRCKGIFDA